PLTGPVDRLSATRRADTISASTRGSVPGKECVMRPPPPRRATIFLATAALALAPTCAMADSPDAPHLARQSVPVPPRQKARWTPPKSIVPDKHVKAAELLFAQGLADPRGCEYRNVSLVTDNADYRPTVQEVHAWVLPGPADAEYRFAICWNG